MLPIIANLLTGTAIPTIYGDVSEIKSEIGIFLGYGAHPTDTTRIEDIDRIYLSGLRRMCKPPVLRGMVTAHRWSWLIPNTTITLADGTADYLMPKNFGGLIGNMYYATGVCHREIVRVPLSKILAYRQGPSVENFPLYVAFDSTAYGPGAVSRIQAYFWPIPDSAYVLTYRYRLIPDKTTDDLPWPPGSPEFTECLTEACLSVAEERRNDEVGLHNGKFQEALAAAIMHDINDTAPDVFGSLGGRGVSDRDSVTARPTFTFNGTVVP